jgi:hypothetical protein
MKTKGTKVDKKSTLTSIEQALNKHKIKKRTMESKLKHFVYLITNPFNHYSKVLSYGKFQRL